MEAPKQERERVSRLKYKSTFVFAFHAALLRLLVSTIAVPGQMRVIFALQTVFPAAPFSVSDVEGAVVKLRLGG